MAHVSKMYRNPIANVNCTHTKTCALNLVQTETVSLTRLLGKRKSTKNETVSLYMYMDKVLSNLF